MAHPQSPKALPGHGGGGGGGGGGGVESLLPGARTCPAAGASRRGWNANANTNNTDN